jgi:hypothetical protein
VGKAEICIHNKHFNIEHLYKIANVLEQMKDQFKISGIEVHVIIQ